METQSLIIITLLLASFAAMVWWLMRENRELNDFLNRKKLDITTTERLMRFAWSRTTQMLLTTAFCIVIIISYDWQLNETRDAVLLLNDSLETRQAADDARAAADAAKAAAPAPAALALAPAAPQIPDQGIKTTPQSSAPVTLTTPDQALTATEGSASPSPLNEGLTASTTAIETLAAEQPPSTLEQVYNPEREQGSNGDDQSSMDDIKKRYEDILVIYMFLKQCGRIESSDYNIITSALAQEMASVNAPGRMQYDVVNSAKGSYQEIYSQSPCEGDGINKLTNQYHQYIEVLKTNFPPQ